MRFFDAHVHLQDPAFAGLGESFLDHLPPKGIAGAVVNGTHEGDWDAVAALAKSRTWVFPSYGLHPWYVGGRSLDWRARLDRRLDEDGAAGIGEIGLDRWILTSARRDDRRLAGLPRASLSEQIDVLQTQLQRAARENRPMTLHCLQAWDELETVLAESPLPSRGFLLHAYSGPAGRVPWLLKRGAHFSFNGHHCHPRFADRRAIFASLPPDRLLVETDAPAMIPPLTCTVDTLPPRPDGTAVNHPVNLLGAYRALSELRKVDLAGWCDQIETNHLRFFGHPRIRL